MSLHPELLFSESTLSEADEPPNSTVDRVSTINNQHYQFHNDYDNENSFPSESEHDDAALNNALNRGPFFDISASKNVTALVGNTAYLNCRVRNLGNKTVMLSNDCSRFTEKERD
jgi:hypothetical protein